MTDTAKTEDVVVAGNPQPPTAAAPTATASSEPQPKPQQQPEANSHTANDAFDAIEKSLGISEYFASSSISGFTAVVKARYSDFLVHEIDLDGTVATLTSLEVPQTKSSSSSAAAATIIAPPTKPPSATIQEEVKAAETTTIPTTTTTPKKIPTTAEKSGDKMEVEKEDANANAADAGKKSSPFDEFESQLSELIDNPEVAKNVMVLLESHENPDKTTDEKFVVLPALEKQQRKSVHEWVRNALTCAHADTLDGKIRIWHAKFEKEMPNYKAFGTSKKRKMSDKALRKKARHDWPQNRPDFLRFVLYKENCDTGTATKDVSRRGSTARIGYAGMKDKRGITSQFCTMYRTLPEQIANGKHPQRGGGGGNTKQKGYSIVHIGNFEYVPKELRLGSLRGNRFDIILRNVRLLDENGDASAPGNDTTNRRKVLLEQAAQTMKDKGFLNYFGTQRFGKFHNTHLVGIAVLQGDFKKAVDILMAPSDEDRPDITKARKDWQERFTYGNTKENESSTAKRVLKRYE